MLGMSHLRIAFAHLINGFFFTILICKKLYINVLLLFEGC